MKYSKIPETVEATQWFENGDHPQDNCEAIKGEDGYFQSEGKVVRYFRHPQIAGKVICYACGHIYHDHGWIDASIAGATVCPGDYVISGPQGGYYVWNKGRFESIYAPTTKEPK
jgi:hypothetical protein